MKKVMMLLVTALAVVVPTIADGEVPLRTVTFNANGGTVDGAATNAWTVYDGGRLDSADEYYDNYDLPTPVLNGYFFLGWFTAANGGDEVTADMVVTADMTLYAHWEEIVYTYTYIDNDDGTVTLAKWDELGYWLGDGVSPSPVGEFTVPTVIGGKSVVAIGDYFFDGCHGLTSLVIPGSVTNISCYALPWAYDLTNITVAADNPAYKSVDGILYTKDGKMLVACPRAKGGTVSVASGTENVGRYAFYYNYDLTAISFPEGLKVIDDYAFEYCQNENFTSVTFPASVVTIGDNAFGYCSYLTNVTFSGNEPQIDIAATAFVGTPYDATKPFSLIFSDYVGSLIGFHGVAPETLVLSNYLNGTFLTLIGEKSLSGCCYDTSSMTNVIVPEGVTWIDRYAFADDAALVSVTLPASLQGIEYGAFQNCTSLREISVPAGVTYMSDLFYGCTNLTVHAPTNLCNTFTVPEENGCTIEYYEVPECTVTFDANGGTVDGAATTAWTVYEGRRLDSADEYYDNYDLPTPVLNGYFFLGWFTAASGGEEVTADTVVTGDMTLYAHWEEIVYTYNYIDNGDGPVTLARYYWDENGNWITEGMSPSPVGEFTVPSEIEGKQVVAIVGDYFNDCGEMKSIVIPASVTNLSGNVMAIYSLTNITVAADNPAYKSVDGILYTKDGKTLVACPLSKGGDIVVSSGTECIGNQAFHFNYYNYNLTSVMLPDGLKVIESEAFAYCQNESFTSIVIPASVERIAQNAFACCSYLTNVTFSGNEAQIYIDATAFVGTPYDAAKPFSLIINEDGTLVGFHGIAPETLAISNYLNGTVLTRIGNSALSAWNYDTSSMTNVVVPEGVTWIGSYAFASDTALQSVALPISIRSIYNNAFQYCSSLREIWIPAGVESISGDVFYGCTNLTVHAPTNLCDTFSVPDGCTIEYYEVPECTVTFDANGGTIDGEESYETTVLQGRVLTLGQIPQPYRAGYDFAGWFDGNGQRVSSDFIVMGNVTLTARWLEPLSWYWYADGDVAVISGARDVSVVTNGILTIPETITARYDDGEEVDLPVAGIRYWAFEYWGSVGALVLPSSVEWIGSGAFYGCGSLTNVTFMGDREAIEMGGGLRSVFDGTPWLNAQPFTLVTHEENGDVYLVDWYGSPVPTETLQLPNNVTVVRTGALPSLYWQGEGYANFIGWYTAVEGGERVGGNVDVSVAGGTILYARWESVTPEWYFEIEDGKAILTGNSVSLIGDIEIPATVTVEEDDGEGNPQEVAYTVVAIGAYSFEDMDGMTSVTIPSSVTNIGAWAFAYCRGLTNVVFEGGMESIDMNVYREFYYTPWASTLPKPANDEYEHAQTLESGDAGTVEGTLTGATIADNDCIWRYGYAERTVWYKWVASFTGTARFVATAANGESGLLYLVATHGYDAVNEEWDDCGYDQCNSVTFRVQAGETYYVSLATWNFVASEFSLSWQEIQSPDNDAFANAIMINGEYGRTAGTNIGAGVEDGEPLPLEEEGTWTFDTTASVWWKWTAPTNGTFTFKTLGSDFDTVIGIYTGSAVDVLSRIAANDEGFRDHTSVISIDAVAETTYYIAVGGYRKGTGNVALSWTAGDELVPSIDANASAETVTNVVKAVGFVDEAAVMEAIGGNASGYNAFAAWAQGVIYGEEAVALSSQAARSYLLGADALIDEITSDDVQIVSFEVLDGGTAISGQPSYRFTFEVEINGVDIGAGTVEDAVLKENLRKVLVVEGAETLASEAFSPNNIDLAFDTPEDGRAKITATRRIEDNAPVGNSFFMRVKVK